MDNFKIDLFEKENSIKFPEYKTLVAAEAKELLNQIAQKYNLDIKDFANQLSAKQTFHSSYSNELRLKELLFQLGISPHCELLVNWNKFETIDIFKLEDLDKYLDEIWFPVTDDIDIFDKTTDWILSISHYESISFILKH